MKHLTLGMIGLTAIAATGAFCAAQAQVGGAPTDPPAQFQAMVIDPTGTTRMPNGTFPNSGDGIRIENASHNQIGSTDLADRNIAFFGLLPDRAGTQMNAEKANADERR